VRGSRDPADIGLWGRCSSIAQCDSLGADYVIVYDSSLLSEAWVDSLAKHRAEWHGYNVAVVSDSDAVSISEQVQLSSYALRRFAKAIYDGVDAEHMTDGPPGYLLLVGDAREDEENDYMPAHEYGGTVTSDHWYGCVDDLADSLVADMMIGRLCVDTDAELQEEVERIIDYEEGASAESWRQKALLTCGFAWGDECEPGDEECESCQRLAPSADSTFNYIDAKWGGGAPYSFDQIHAHDYDLPYWWQQQTAAEEDNLDAINDGRHIVVLCAHGSKHDARGFSWLAVPGLDNAGKLPLWMSFSCETGAFDAVEADSGLLYPTHCLGERLLHQENGTGAIAYLGATEECSMTSWEHLGKYMWEGLLDHHHYEIGQSLAFAKLKDLSALATANNTKMYNLLGDPALNLLLLDDEGYAGAPDYAVSTSDLSFSPVAPCCGDTVKLSAVIYNRSNCEAAPGVTVPVVFSILERDGTFWEALTDTPRVHVGSWDSTLVSVNWCPEDSEVGHWLMKVSIDTNSLELWKNNNVAEGLLPVYFECQGFPRALGASGSALSPTVADIDVDGDLEVLAGNSDPGRITALSASGDSLWSYVAAAPIHGPAAVADIGLDGQPEVIVTTGSFVRALTNADPPVETWMRYLKYLRSTAASADLEFSDGQPEVLVEGMTMTDAHFVAALRPNDGGIYWKEELAAPHADVHGSSCPAVADLDGDGTVEVVSTCDQESQNTVERLWVVDCEGALLWARHLIGNSVDRASNPVVGELDGEEAGLEIVCGAHAAQCFSCTGDTLWSKWLLGRLVGALIGDLDGDGYNEVAASVAIPEASAAASGMVYVLEGSTGAPIDSCAIDYPAIGAPIMAYVDNDEEPELLVASTESYWVGSECRYRSHVDVLTLSAAGALSPFEYLPRPLLFCCGIADEPAVADTDDDGSVEIWVVDDTGLVHCLEYWGQSGPQSPWPSFQGDERHTATYETPVSGAYPESTSVSWWGDYLLTGDVTVDSWSRLLIQPGTSVRVAPLQDDQASGVDTSKVELVIEEDARLDVPSGVCPVELTSAADSPALGDWRGIRLRGSSTGKLAECEVAYAVIGIDAASPDTVVVEQCCVESCLLKGIQVYGGSGQSFVRLIENDIAGGLIGMEFHDCHALVDSNALSSWRMYGMKIYDDYGSDVIDNTITDKDGGEQLSGMYVQACRGTLEITGNTFQEVGSTGLQYEMPYGTDQGHIHDNSVVCASGCTRGMYFYDSAPLVRWNDLESPSTAYFIEMSGASLAPDLGDAPGSDGDNSLSGTGTTYGVYVVGVYQGPVTAENNWWATTDTTELAQMFVGQVDYDPWLDSAPSRERSERGSTAELHELRFCLKQNSPNPFNPWTSISYAVPEPSHVSLDIYDVAGRHVATIVDDTREAGWHTQSWRGTDDSGHSVASGVYFCRLVAGNRADCKKIVLLK